MDIKPDLKAGLASVGLSTLAFLFAISISFCKAQPATNPNYLHPVVEAAGTIPPVGVNSGGHLTQANLVDTGYLAGSPISTGLGGSGLASLTQHYVLVGNGTSPLTLVPPSSVVGSVFASNGLFADPSFQQPLTGNYNSSVMTSTYLLSQPTGVFEDIGLSTTCSGAGQFKVHAELLVLINIQSGNASITCQLYDATAAAYLVNTERKGIQSVAANVNSWGTPTITQYITTTGSHTIKVYCETVFSGGTIFNTGGRGVYSDSMGRSFMDCQQQGTP